MEVPIGTLGRSWIHDSGDLFEFVLHEIAALGKNWIYEIGDYLELEFVSRTHPTVMQWTLVTYFWKCLVIQAMYFIFIMFVGPYIMKNRKPFDLRWFMVPYNIFLIVANFYLFFQFAMVRWKGGIEVQCNTMSTANTDPNKYRLTEITWYFYMTKYIELIDTVIFVLRKKDRQLSRLHIVHHTFVPILVLFILRSEPGGYNSFFPLANSFVHSIMYTYYGIAALGDDVTIHLQFKQYVTITQLIQFILVMYYYFSRPFYGCYWSGVIAYGNLVLAGFFFVLFCNFYWHEYVKKPEEEEPETRKSLDQNGFKKEL